MHTCYNTNQEGTEECEEEVANTDEQPNSAELSSTIGSIL